MKTKEELNGKHVELTDEELAQVAGGKEQMSWSQQSGSDPFQAMGVIMDGSTCGGK